MPAKQLCRVELNGHLGERHSRPLATREVIDDYCERNERLPDYLSDDLSADFTSLLSSDLSYDLLDWPSVSFGLSATTV